MQFKNMQKLKKLIHSIVLCMISFSCKGLACETKGMELRQCLEESWGVDRHTAAYIIKRFDPLLHYAAFHPVIDDFIEKSSRVIIDFSSAKEIQPLPPDDGVVRAPQQHLVVFENPYVRILWGSTQPGEREPFHVHAWRSLLVVLQPTTFTIEYPDGSMDVWKGEVGVFELPANERYACTNSGNSPDEILRFEIK